MYTVGFYTLGCKVSSYETEALREEFLRCGFRDLPFDELCDVYVINTCTVTAEGDAKSRKYIRRAKRMNPKAVVVVMGCYSQRSPDEIAALGCVDVIIGTDGKMRAAELALGVLNGEITDTPIVTVASLDGVVFEPMCITEAPRTRAYVKIEDGCECRCSYCAISAARGPVRSKQPSDVLSEVKALASKGTREVVLTGIETGSYGKDIGTTLEELILLLDKEKAVERIRLGSMAPELMGEKFISALRNSGILVPHFHISMQSGSSRILALMRRRYNREQAMINIARIKSINPSVMLTADLMVGFPGESDEDFADTLSFVREARLLDAHVFIYSEREGTDAVTFKDKVQPSVAKARSAALIAEKNRVRDEILCEVTSRGEPLKVIFESEDGGYYTGHTDSYIEVVAKSSRNVCTELIEVIPEYAKDGKIYCKIPNM